LQGKYTLIGGRSALKQRVFTQIERKDNAFDTSMYYLPSVEVALADLKPAWNKS
jgi:hypothetical protein